MLRAIALARQTHVQTLPNPKVACLIVDGQGKVVGEGVHGQAGIDHAEVIALQQASTLARGATAYVTLEPCAHVGKTGPCVEALVKAGVKRVVFAVSDLKNGGRNFLKDQSVDVLDGVCESEALHDLAPWLHTEICGTPYVTLKVASTLDGYIAAPDATSQWITSDASRHFVQQVRLEVDAIITSTETVRQDNPQFTVRDFEVAIQPHVYVVGESDVTYSPELRSRSTRVKSHDPFAVLSQAVEDGRRHLLIEAGGKIAAAFLRANLVNRVIWISAPIILGDGRKAVQGLEIQTLKEALRGRVAEHFSLADDFVTVLQMNHCSH